MGSYKRTTCRLCNSRYLEKVLPLNPIPTSEQYTLDSISSLNQKRYPIDIYQCLECLHIQQLDIVDPEFLWKEYSYFSGATSNMPSHFIDEYKIIEKSFSKILRNKKVLDIGSNDGSFLQVFKNNNWKVVGVDPAEAPSEIANKNKIKTLNSYFDISLKEKIYQNLEGAPSLITMYNAFAHIDNIDKVLSDIVQILDKDNPSLFRFEVQYVASLIKDLLIPSIFHEHISHYSLISLSRFLSKHDLVIVDATLNNIQHGSLVITATSKNNINKFPKSITLQKLLLEESTNADVYYNSLSQMKNRIDIRKEITNNLLSSIMEKSSAVIAGYGAARSASTIISQLEIRKYLQFIYDSNINKKDHYVAGEGLKIRSEISLEKDFPDCIIILAWVHNKLIIKKLSKYIQKGGKVVSLFPSLELHTKEGIKTLD